MPSIGPDLPPHLLSTIQTRDDSDDEPGPSIGPVPPHTAEAGSRLPTEPRVPAGPSIGPQVPSSAPPEHEEEEEDDDAYAPELPPDLLPPKPAARVQGPALPPGAGAARYAEDSDDDDFGPMPLPAGAGTINTDAVQEFREREEARRKAAEEAAKPKKLQREEWMLKPPTSSDLLSNIDPTKIVRGGRRFAASTKPAASRDTDSTLWTETPAERQQRLADEVAGKRRRAENAAPAESEGEALERAKRRRQEAEVRKGVDEYTVKHRGASLVNQHTSGTASQPQDPTEAPPGIWDHSRDMALSGRLLDDKTRERIIKDARGLGDRFGSGKSGGFM